MNTHFNFRYTPSVAILQLSSHDAIELYTAPTAAYTQNTSCIHNIYHAHTIYHVSPTNQQRCISSICSSSSCVELNEIQDNCMTATLGSYLKLNLLFIQICSLDIGIWCISSIFNVVSCVEHNYI